MFKDTSVGIIIENNCISSRLSWFSARETCTLTIVQYNTYSLFTNTLQPSTKDGKYSNSFCNKPQKNLLFWAELDKLN